MLPIARGTTDKYLADLNRTQDRLQRIQNQVTSGIRVQQASDDPAVVPEILQIQNDLNQNQQVQRNLGNVKAEIDTADTAMQTAVQIIENAIALAAQGITSTSTPQARSILAKQIAGLQETLVGLSQATVNGRYVFSGDQDTQPAYQLDLSQPKGVTQLVSATATRVIKDANGATIATVRTAGQLFDPRNPDSTPAAANAFAALNSLRLALENNDTAGISQAQNGLHAADNHLNVQAAFYGNAQTRVTDSLNLAAKFQVQQQGELSQLRDTDITSAALELTQLGIQQQASLAVQAKTSKLSLFDFLN
jgi:flagellar hook-associated protein 3 FlgL